MILLHPMNIVAVLNDAVSQHANVGCAGCDPVTSHEHVAVLNDAVSQHANVGCAGCDPEVSHEHVVVLKVNTSQQFT